MTPREDIYAVLMSLHDDHLLLPNAAVAEVVGMEQLVPVERASAPWLRGHCEWNGRQVPVISFEQLNDGDAASGDSRRQRIVILHAFGRHLAQGYVAVLTQGYPHLLTLTRNALRSLPRQEGGREGLVLAHVGIANQHALIPNLDAIEADIARAQLSS